MITEATADGEAMEVMADQAAGVITVAMVALVDGAMVAPADPAGPDMMDPDTMDPDMMALDITYVVLRVVLQHFLTDIACCGSNQRLASSTQAN